MNIIVLDFETYFDKTYTLNKLTTEEYIRDPRFEVHGVGVSVDNGTRREASWYRHPREFFTIVDWSRAAVLCHHAHFDGLILSHHFGIRPAFWLDTLSMARARLGTVESLSLESLAKRFGLGSKKLPFDLMQGKHWHEMPPGLQDQIAGGCCNDVLLTLALYYKLQRSAPQAARSAWIGFPQDELRLIDSTIRMFTEPCLTGNTPRLAELWEKEEKTKTDLLNDLKISGAELRTGAGFTALLEAEGIEVEHKTTAKGNTKPCFAKTDTFMQDLVDDWNPRVAALARARLAAKSNIVQTRCSRLGFMSTRGPLCVYLAYAAAHTGRWGGGDKLNWQNFPRDSGLGKAIEAPPGHMLVSADASQIEARVLLMLAGQMDAIERFRQHHDPYIAIASEFYGFEVTKANPKERGTGKQLTLSCGYGAGAATIKATARRGAYGPPVILTDEMAAHARDLYRKRNPAVVGLWREADGVLHHLHAGTSYLWRGCLSVHDKRITLPNGLYIDYSTLDYKNEWTVQTRHGRAKLYGAKLVENVIQALARIIVSQVWIKLLDKGVKCVSMEHDKLIVCVPEDKAGEVLTLMQTEMARAPAWLPGLPLDSEGHISKTLSH